MTHKQESNVIEFCKHETKCGKPVFHWFLNCKSKNFAMGRFGSLTQSCLVHVPLVHPSVPAWVGTNGMFRWKFNCKKTVKTCLTIEFFTLNYAEYSKLQENNHPTLNVSTSFTKLIKMSNSPIGPTSSLAICNKLYGKMCSSEHCT